MSTTEQPTNQLPKTYSPAATEPAVSLKWDEAKAFHADPARVVSGEAEPYCVLIPPPNVTAALHLGHALNNTLQDVLVRAHRMMGYETLWMPGTDHAGIATQAVVERRLRQEGKLKGPLKDAMSRDEFVMQVQAWKDEYEATITEQLKSMGCSCDWDRQRFTMDEQCAAAVREAFFHLFRAGLIYRGKRLVNWDPVLQTAVADDECEDIEIDGFFYYLRYPLVHAEGNTKDGADPMPVTWDELARRGYPGADQHAADEQAFVTVATTRPETYLGDTAVALNPHDPRAKALKGLFVELPLVGRVIPIVEDSYVVLPAAMQADPEAAASDPKAQFATGFLKVTPAHDPNDYEIGQRHNLEKINVMAPDASISDKHGWTDVEDAHLFVGLSREEARKKVVAEFKARGLLEDKKPYKHSVKHSDRSKAAIEPYLSDQWYVRVTDPRLAQSANAALVPEQRTGAAVIDKASSSSNEDGDGSLRFYPPRYAKTYEQWHDNIRDWCISRQLWWGHQIPVWTVLVTANLSTDDCKTDDDWKQKNLKFLQVQFEKLQNYIEAHGCNRNDLSMGSDPFTLCVATRTLQSHHAMQNLQKCLAATQPDNCQNGIASNPQATFTTLLAKYPRAQGIASDLYPTIEQLDQDPDVLDTWFSSALWPLSTLGWPNFEHNDLLEAFNPTSVLCTAREIITLWVSRMVMFNRYFLSTPDNYGGAGDGQVPFKDVFIHAMIQDGEGRKMSKSLGNGVDPRDIIASHGSDAMRFTLVQMTTQTQDVRMPVARDDKTGKNTSPKFDTGRNFCNKLWNTTRFVLEKLSAASTNAVIDATPIKHSNQLLSLLDRWMLSRLATTVRDVNAALETYDYSAYAESMYRLLWWDLCDWYLEGVKPTVADNPMQRAVLTHTLETIVRLLHPIAPFITEAVWEHLRHLTPRTAPIDGVKLSPSRKGDLLATAGWPEISEAWIDAESEARFEKIREAITAIRNLRSEHQVAPKRRVTLHATPGTLSTLNAVPGLIETLCNLAKITPEPPASDTPAVALRVWGEELFLTDLSDAVNAGVETERLHKIVTDKAKEITTLEGRLNNPGYADRAPAKLVEESRAKLAKAKEEYAAAIEALKKLGVDVSSLG